MTRTEKKRLTNKKRYLEKGDAIRKQQREYARRPEVGARKKVYMAEYYKRWLDNPEKIAKQKRAGSEWYKKNKSAIATRRWLWGIQKKYGLKRDQWDGLILEYLGACGVCGEQPKEINVDHDHTTGEVRGLLCFRCNILLGVIEKNPIFLKNLYNYLIRPS